MGVHLRSAAPARVTNCSHSPAMGVDLRRNRVGPAAARAGYGEATAVTNQITIRWHRGGRGDRMDTERGAQAERAALRLFGTPVLDSPLLVSARPTRIDSETSPVRRGSGLGCLAKAALAGVCLVLAGTCFMLLCVARAAKAGEECGVRPASMPAHNPGLFDGTDLLARSAQRRRFVKDPPC
jgi:hypothetical protein